MQDELYALHDNNTWELVPRPPSVNMVGSKWVFRLQMKDDGSINRFKARLVTQGYSSLKA